MKDYQITIYKAGVEPSFVLVKAMSFAFALLKLSKITNESHVFKIKIEEVQK